MRRVRRRLVWRAHRLRQRRACRAAQLFKSVEYRKGGVASGFKKVERGVYETRLLQVKGHRVLRVMPVEPTVHSFKSGASITSCLCSVNLTKDGHDPPLRFPRGPSIARSIAFPLPLKKRSSSSLDSTQPVLW